MKDRVCVDCEEALSGTLPRPSVQLYKCEAVVRWKESSHHTYMYIVLGKVNLRLGAWPMAITDHLLERLVLVSKKA